MLKFGIIDDELKIVSNLSHLLESIFIQNNFDAMVVFETSVAHDFINYINNNKIDVLFLDIDLNSNISGFDIAKIIRKNNKNCYLIFISAFSQYSLNTFKYKTFDFITKPFDKSRIEECINRLFEDIYGNPRKYIKIDNKNTIIDESEIEFIQRDGMKIVFHTKSRDYMIYSSFNKIENRLPSNFIRCHKSFIANIKNISKIEPLNNQIFFNNSFCDIGPKYKNKFLEVMNNYGNIK